MKTVAVDLDGVLAKYDGWKGIDHVGDPVPGAKEFIEELCKEFSVIIYTTRCRESKGIARVVGWLIEWNFPKEVTVWTEGGKPLAVAYIDDRAVTCRPQEDSNAFRTALEQVRKLN